MREWDILTPVEAMPRITRQELAEKLDEILDDVTDNNKAYVIHDDDKKEYVLCPAKWLDFHFDDDFGCIINSAVRYALGRYTYMPGVVMNFVRKYMKVLDTRTIHVMIEDIERDCQNESLPYIDEWTALKLELIERVKQMQQQKEENEKT